MSKYVLKRTEILDGSLTPNMTGEDMARLHSKSR